MKREQQMSMTSKKPTLKPRTSHNPNSTGLPTLAGSTSPLVVSKEQLYPQKLTTQQRPTSAASYTRPNNLNSNILQKDLALAQQYLHVKDADLELAKARYDFQVSLEKKKTNDFQQMLKDNYEESTKMFQQLNSNKIELLQKQNQDFMQKLLQKSEEDVATLRAAYEKKFHEMMESKLHVEQEYETKLKQAKNDFNDSLQKKKEEFEKRVKENKQKAKQDYKQKLENEKEKMQKELEQSIKEKEEEFNQKLKYVFERMHSEYEEKEKVAQEELAEKEKDVSRALSKVEVYKKEVDRWKEMYYELESKAAELEETVRAMERKQLYEPSHRNQSDEVRASGTLNKQSLELSKSVVQKGLNESQIADSPKKKTVACGVQTDEIKLCNRYVQTEAEVVERPQSRGITLSQPTVTVQTQIASPKRSKVVKANVQMANKATETEVVEVITPRGLRTPKNESNKLSDEKEIKQLVVNFEKKTQDAIKEVLVEKNKEIANCQMLLKKCLSKIKEYQALMCNFETL